MVHYFIGNLGHLMIILSLVTALLSCIAYFKAAKSEDHGWTRYADISYYFHVLSLLGVLVVLFLIINKHYFEYHYAWNYSSKYLPIYYQISSFWNGQEGSFLLWMFWNAMLGLVLIKTNKYWKPSVMTVMTFTQFCLTTLILGVVIFDVKIGSSPFLLLRDVIPDAVFIVNPEFVPADGNGLNPLLQNYWMVIHPPTLFLGFASTVVPFAYAVAGLWMGKYKDWIRPALPWAQFSGLVLGVGILMGAYWAYETLNFGGYWNWDPVENAIYIPWLILIASIHTMIAYKKNENALKASIILVLATYLLILYSTFLTRSGVLGETSVHSFTDLGLSGQLLLFLGLFLIGCIALCAYEWKKIPTTEQEMEAYSREFWIFLGATVLSLMAFQILIPTSIPVYNEILGLFGVDSNLAPPADPVGFYSKFQLWFAVAIAVLSGTGQFFWWKKMDLKKFRAEIQNPLIVSLLISAAIFILAEVREVPYMILLTASVYTIVANAAILWSLKRTSLKLSGGSVAHMGVGLMLIGILFSSGYSKILSKNTTGLIYSKEFPDEINLNNLLLFLNEPREMGDYSLVYKGMRKKTNELGYVDSNKLTETDNPLRLMVTDDIYVGSDLVAARGDTLGVTNNENSYFEVIYEKEDGSQFSLYPRVQLNKQMGTVYSPDISRTLTADMYTHVRTFPDPEQETDWGEVKEYEVAVGGQFFINDYVANFVKMQRVDQPEGIPMSENDVAVKAVVEIQGEYQNYVAEPLYLIKDQMAAKIPETVYDLAARITIESINPETNSFTFGVQRTQKDWIIMEAVEKPFINLLWIGTLLVCFGFFIAILRRYWEFIIFRDKGLES
jgi:cytochrome c-type biogenesis protein CcmF|tara:strand:+ start:9895 stop:12414 length:2520 start_codon:yes stop_codon:yes gene_type:complete